MCLAIEYIAPACPNCGAPLDFPSTAEKVVCKYCGRTVYTIKHELNTQNLNNQPVQTIFDTTYPMPDDARNFSKPLRGDQINFQTNLSLEQITTFYRRAFAERELTEIELLTNITEESISLVFKGADDVRQVVLQAVDLAYGTNMDLRNVNLRTEKDR